MTMEGKIDETYAGSLTERVKKALLATRAHDPKRYCEMFENHSEPSGGHGSTYPATIEEIESDLLKKSWFSYEHPAVTAPCIAAVAKLGGKLGIVPIAGLPTHTKFTLVDHKNDGYCELLLEGDTPRRHVNFTCIILGPDGPDNLEVVYTFHPGDPIVPSELHGLAKGELKKGDEITLAYALERGFTYAKMV